MTILNRNQLQGREGMFWNPVCVEMAKGEGFTSKAGGSDGRNKQWEPWEWRSGGGDDARPHFLADRKGVQVFLL